MPDYSRQSDPDENYLFSRDWNGAGRIKIKLEQEAARWLEARRKKREARRDPRPYTPVRLRVWRAST